MLDTAQILDAPLRDGATLRLRLFGTGPRKLILVHPLAMDGSVWEGVAAHLPSDVQAVAIDCRGHGASSRVGVPYSYDQFADDILDAMDVLGWDSAALAGCSMGGCVAQAFAARHSTCVTGIALIDTTAWYGEDAPRTWSERAHAASEKGFSALVGFQQTRWFSDAFRDANPEIVARTTAIFIANNVESYVATCTMMGQADLRTGLGSIKVPAIVVVGEEDYATPVAAAEYLVSQLADARMQIIAKARHFTLIERPDAIAEAILEIVPV